VSDGVVLELSDGGYESVLFEKGRGGEERAVKGEKLCLHREGVYRDLSA